MPLVIRMNPDVRRVSFAVFSRKAAADPFRDALASCRPAPEGPADLMFYGVHLLQAPNVTGWIFPKNNLAEGEEPGSNILQSPHWGVGVYAFSSLSCGKFGRAPCILAACADSRSVSFLEGATPLI